MEIRRVTIRRKGITLKGRAAIRIRDPKIKRDLRIKIIVGEAIIIIIKIRIATI